MNSKIVVIEPEPEPGFFPWLADKGRLFFDSVSMLTSKNPRNFSNLLRVWSHLPKNSARSLYFFDHCNQTQTAGISATLVFENLSLETIGLLTNLESSSSFIRTSKAESYALNTDLESRFVLNLSLLDSSSLAVLLAINPRLEGYYLNLQLRQRLQKGDFRCVVIGSLINLTFPTTTLGSSGEVSQALSEGSNLACRDIITSKKVSAFTNFDFMKRVNNYSGFWLFSPFCFVKNETIVNLLNSSLYQAGVNALSKTEPFKKSDLAASGIFLFLGLAGSTDLKATSLIKLMGYLFERSVVSHYCFVMDVNVAPSNNHDFSKGRFKFSPGNKSANFYYLPSSMFYESCETFITAAGAIKQSSKLIFSKNTQHSWQVLRKLGRLLKASLAFPNSKNRRALAYDQKDEISCYIFYHYLATQTLINFSGYLLTKIKPFVPLNAKIFKQSAVKVSFAKLTYWLDDFYTGGKDDYSKDSFVLSNCSKNQRLSYTSFFSLT